MKFEDSAKRPSKGNIFSSFRFYEWMSEANLIGSNDLFFKCVSNLQ